MNKIELTSKLPDKPGYYWWTNFSEHAPYVLRVERLGRELWASGQEYNFKIKKSKKDKDDRRNHN